MKSLIYITFIILCILLSVFKFSLGEDLYRILGVSKSASNAEIKRSYKKLARTWHPDKNKDPDANEKFMKINEAYETLIDEDKRRHYDNFGKTASSTGHQSHRGDHELFNSFRAFFGGFGDFKFNYDRDEDEKYLVTFRKYTNIILPETSKKPYVIFAYSNICLQCMKVDVVWEKFVSDLEDIDFGIGTFNAELDRALTNRVGITSVPTIVMIINKKIKYFSNEYTQTNMREFVRKNLPNKLIKILNDDNVEDFLKDYSSNKIRVIFSNSKSRPSLRFLSTAFAFQNRFEFGFISNSDARNKRFRQSYKLYQSREILLLFHEYYDSAFASLYEPRLQGKNIENILESNKYLILPRLSSPSVFNELCPIGTTRRSKAVCVVLFTYNIQEHEKYRQSFRNFVRHQSNEQRVKYTYVYADSQTQFTEAIIRRDGIENATSKALKVALIWRNSKLDLHYSILEEGWKIGESNQQSVIALRKLIDSAVNTRDTLDFKIDQPSIVDEHQAPLFSRIINRLDDWYDLGMIKIRSMDSATWFAIFVSIIVVLGIGLMSSALSRPDKPLSQTRSKDGGSSHIPKEKPTVYLQKFCPQTYENYVLNGEKGLRTLIIMTDNECQNKLLQKFASIVLPYTNGDAFIFCALDLDDYLEWYRHLLELTLDFRRDLSTINKKNCVGTVLALNGSRRYYSIFHPKLPSNDFLGLEDSSDGENQNDTTLNINDVLNVLGLWMDRLCEGQIKRFRVQYWPPLSH